MEIKLPVPLEVLAEKMGLSSRSLETYIAKLRKLSPDILTLYETKGTYEGYKKTIYLYALDLVPILEQFKRTKKTVQSTVVTPKTEQKKRPPVVEPANEQAMFPDKIIDSDGTDTNYSEKRKSFFTKKVDWKAVFLILEAGASLEEAAGYLKVDQLLLSAECMQTFGISFTQLKNYCYYSGNVKIKLSLYSAAVGTKERRPNPLIQILMGKDRIGLGTKDLELPSNPKDIIYLDGKEHDMNEMGDQELDKRYKELEDRINEINNGKP